MHPNILFLMTDQHRWDALGSSGNWVKTPNLDRIARCGTQFTNCITTSPVCVPARVTLATGQYPHNNGVWNHIPYRLPFQSNTWMSAIRSLGYRTSVFGKTHLTPHGGADLRDNESLLHSLGLDDLDEIAGPRASAKGMSNMVAVWEREGFLEEYRADFEDRFAHKQYVVRPSTLPLDYYYDVYVGQQARRYLSAYDSEKPWFCWVSWGGPHQPWDTPEPYASMYAPELMPNPAGHAEALSRPKGRVDLMMQRNSPNFEDGEVAAMRADYAGSISLIDHQIGKILDLVAERGELESTIIAFTSDHGEMNGDHGLISKSNFYDGAVRVPLILKRAGMQKLGVVNKSPVETVDLGPTLVELAGGELSYRQFGKSFVSALDGSSHRDDALSEIGGELMLMNEEWKVALNEAGDVYMLFDRKNDPLEEHNLAGEPKYRSYQDDLRLRILERVVQSQLYQAN